LAQAAARGVDVRVLLPAKSDVLSVGYAVRRLYGWLMKRGIKLHEWPQSILHGKTAVVDDDWCTVGTHNVDYRSWALNLEVNVAVRSREVAAALADRFEADLARAIPVQAAPRKWRSLGDRLLELFFYQFRKLM
jgi:cardiolipin synthase